MQEFTIHGFRGIQGLELKQLKEVNLLVGSNNSGKTSVLEAIELFCDPFSQGKIYKVARSRDRHVSTGIFLHLDSILWLFPKEYKSLQKKSSLKKDISFASIVKGAHVAISFTCMEKNALITSHAPFQQVTLFEQDRENEGLRLDEIVTQEVKMLEIQIEGMNKTNQQHKTKSFQMHAKQTQLVSSFADAIGERLVFYMPTELIAPIEHRVRPISARDLNDTIKSGDRTAIIELLQYFDKNIEGLELLAPDGVHPVPHINHKELGFTPVYAFGDGLRKALTLASAIIRCKNGILLVDEIETAVHTAALSHLFAWLVNACKQYNVQLFATTHSLEAIDAIIEASEECLGRLVAYRLETKEQTSIAKHFSGETLHDLRYEFGQDVR